MAGRACPIERFQMDKPRGQPFPPGNKFGRGRPKGSPNQPSICLMNLRPTSSANASRKRWRGAPVPCGYAWNVSARLGEAL